MRARKWPSNGDMRRAGGGAGDDGRRTPRAEIENEHRSKECAREHRYHGTYHTIPAEMKITPCAFDMIAVVAMQWQGESAVASRGAVARQKGGEHAPSARLLNCKLAMGAAARHNMNPS